MADKKIRIGDGNGDEGNSKYLQRKEGEINIKNAENSPQQKENTISQMPPGQFISLLEPE